MIERADGPRWFCNTCSHDWATSPEGARRDGRFRSLEDLIARTGLRRTEVVTLADIGALNSFGYDRRSALWQAERAVRPSGDLFEHRPSAGDDAYDDTFDHVGNYAGSQAAISVDFNADHTAGADGNDDRNNDDRNNDDRNNESSCPLKPMTEAERLVADYAGTGLTVGRHPMALKRDDLAMRGVLRARDLRTERQGRRVRVAGMVITRQRPGTAKGFVFLTLEDETGVANIIVRPDVFARDRLLIVDEPFLLIDGVLQNQDGVTSVRAEQIQRLRGVDVDFDAHDFY
jgi:error-prone DNA polymerase